MQSIFGMSLKWSSRASAPSGTEAQPVADEATLLEAPVAEDRLTLLNAPAAGNETSATWDPFADLALDRGVSLRWTLRDIRAKRTKFLPVADVDLQLLVDMGLVEMHDGEPALTWAGVTAIE